MEKTDRRYKETREYAPGDGTGEAMARVDRYRARMRERSANADRSPTRSSYQSSGEVQQNKASSRRDMSTVFDQYGSGEWGSGDDSIRQLRREVSFRPDPREP